MVTLTIPNQNKKLSCDNFIDIAPAPSGPVSESEFPKTFRILGSDQEFEAILTGMIRFKLRDLPSMITMLSNGMSPEAFQEYYLGRYPNSHPDQEVAAYIYVKSQPGPSVPGLPSKP